MRGMYTCSNGWTAAKGGGATSEFKCVSLRSDPISLDRHPLSDARSYAAAVERKPDGGRAHTGRGRGDARPSAQSHSARHRGAGHGRAPQRRDAGGEWHAASRACERTCAREKEAALRTQRARSAKREAAEEKIQV
eukprot:scaffold1748_cov258-Pinguiococcus_pyrenoidosus.AAC.4